MKKIINDLLYIVISFLLFYIFVKYIVIAYFPFFFSLFIVMMLTSLLKKLFDDHRILGFIILFLFYVSLSIFIVFIFFHGLQFFYQFLLDFKDYYDLYVLPLIQSFFDIFSYQGIHDFLSYAKQSLDNLFVLLIDKCLYFLSMIPSLFSTYFLIVISSFMFYLGLDECKDYVIKYIPDHYLYYFIKVKNTVFSSIKSYLFTQCQLMIIVFIDLSIAFMIIRIDHVLLFSFLLSFLDALPFIGVGIALIPMSLFYMLVKDYIKAVYILVLYCLINMTRTFLEPRLMKNQLKIPTILLFLSMIIHLRLFGIIGLLISPITLSIIQSLLDNHQ